MKKIFLIFIFFALASCDAPQQNPNFEKNVERAQEWFDKWEEEDLDYLSSKIGDEIEWQGAFYANTEYFTTKEDVVAYISGWIGAMEDINYEPENFYKIYIEFPRSELLRRINLRSREMIKKGAISEIRRFIKLKVPRNKSSNKAIGVKELREYLNKKIQIEDVIEKISIKTRQYAKRQTTWGRGNMSNWNKLNAYSLNKFLKKHMYIRPK